MRNTINISSPTNKVKVVLFSGGRGSEVLSKKLINNSKINLTIAINGYDDGASTGEVRQFLGDSLGPSDYRKNAVRMARELQSCQPSLIDFLDLRFPVGYSQDNAIASFKLISGELNKTDTDFNRNLDTLLRSLHESTRNKITHKLSLFMQEFDKINQPFHFSDCSIGNLVFVGCFLEKSRNFNQAIDEYCKLLQLKEGLIENVTDGTNAFLVAVDRDGKVLGREADIVDASKRNYVDDIFLIDRSLTKDIANNLSSESLENIKRFFKERAKTVRPNPILLQRIAEANLIIYAPGTQHSSLFPSYLTPEVGVTIAGNLKAIKLFITNIQEDAEIPESNALKIIQKAVHYLKEKNTQKIITPCLITHYLINDPSILDADIPYIPLGRLENLEDPRLIRIGNYEDGISGRHDAAKLITPFIESFLRGKKISKIAILLMDTDSLYKISQTILEMLRVEIQKYPFEITVFYESMECLNRAFTDLLPFKVFNQKKSDKSSDPFIETVRNGVFDYIILFESSGMYKGEDIVNVVSLLTNEKFDAVWGSRRLSVKDIRHSYKLRYRRNVILGTISFLGSHFLSLIYLSLYGRYISDTLSGVRAVRTAYLQANSISLKSKNLNPTVLSILLRNQCEILETPVQFFSISPEKVRRSTINDGIQSLLTILWWRIKPKRFTMVDKSV